MVDKIAYINYLLLLFYLREFFIFTWLQWIPLQGETDNYDSYQNSNIDLSK